MKLITNLILNNVENFIKNNIKILLTFVIIIFCVYWRNLF